MSLYLGSKLRNLLIFTMASCFSTVASSFSIIFLVLSWFLINSCESVIIPVTTNTFSNFVSSKNVRLIHVSSTASTKNIESFLMHYKKAAEQLDTYGILLGQVICDESSNFEYCKRERTDRFLFGFRGTKERLVLPISTLADENAIVASALHLALINSVPIIQTSSELYNLEKKCYGKCNIILAYHNTLGTLEHKLFLQLAWAYQQQHVFALTTSIHASPGHMSVDSLLGDTAISSRRHQEPSKQLVALWLVQCKHVTPNLQQHMHCHASLFRNNFSYHHINMFIKGLELPKWMEVEDRFPSTYSRFGSHQIIFVHDKDSKSRVKALAEPLGLAFRGSVGVLVCSKDALHLTPLLEFQHQILPPALVFLPANSSESGTSHDVPSILNELENSYEFILEQLKYEELSEISKESEQENSYHHLLKYPIINLQEDSEVSEISKIHKLEGFSSYFLNTNLKNTCVPTIQLFRVIIYYMDWDIVSQVMLKIFSSLELSYLGVDRSETVNCFTNADKCEKVEAFPTVEIVGVNKSQRFGALSEIDLLNEIYLFVSPEVAMFWSRKPLKTELESDKFKYVTEVAIMAAKNLKEAKHVANIIALLPRKLLLLVGFHDAAAYISQEFNCSSPCIGIKKSIDGNQPIQIFQGNILEDFKQLQLFLKFAVLPVMPELSPDLLPKIRDKLIVISLGSSPTKAVRDVALKPYNFRVSFSWVPRQSSWFEEFRLIHAPAEDNALIALNLTRGCSYLFLNNQNNEQAVNDWIVDIIHDRIFPTGQLHEKQWKPLQPAVDYLKLLEDERNKQDQSIIMDTEDPFISPEALGFAGSII